MFSKNSSKEAAQPNTDVVAPFYLLENKIFLDLSSGSAQFEAAGAGYVDFYVDDPEQVCVFRLQKGGCG